MAQIHFDAAKIAPAANPIEPNRSREWSRYQTSIFDFVEHSRGNAVVEAVAGSGKTTTIVEALSRVQGSSIFLAFNKSIADELKARGVNARTFHSLTYGPVTRFKNTRQVDSDKLRRIMRAEFKGNDELMYGAFASKLVGLGKQIGVGCLVPDVENTWLDIATYHDIEPEDEGADLGRGLQLAGELLQMSNKSSMVDFDDLLYLAVKAGLSLPKFDIVFVDEAQDTNAIQRAILRKIMHSNTRIIAVGDPAQAIYGFRGASSNSLSLIEEEFDCTRLPLTVSYRCAANVVTKAQEYVGHIQAAPGAPEGSVESLGTDWKNSIFKADELVVCRTTKPLLALGYSLLKAHIPARIMGKEIGKGLTSLIERQKAHGIDALAVKLQAWRDRESEKALAKQDDAKVEQVQDKVDAIMTVIEGLPETNRTIPALVQAVDALFSDTAGAVVLATIHKAKGLEADTVYWLNSSKCPSPWARRDWQQQQERNLCYVAVTRAKTTLRLIEDGK